MGPAQQGFRSGDLSRLQADLGLIVDRKFLPFQGPPQALFDGLPLHRPDVHRRLEEFVALTAVFLGLVHGRVRVFDERLRIQPIVGKDAHADAGGDMKIVVVDGVGFGHGLKHSPRRNGGILRAFHFGKQHHEFIAALPAYGVRGAYTFHQPLGDGLQKLVAGGMAQGVVDVFEAIQVQKQDCHSLVVTGRQGDRLADPVVQ